MVLRRQRLSLGSVVTLADKLAWFRRVENGPATMADSQQK
jgi:uroporphyrin-III C-methyltransferase/precorrin-2 dehydrogenase/sirohydrochlorin ferrochelatase